METFWKRIRRDASSRSAPVRRQPGEEAFNDIVREGHALVVIQCKGAFLPIEGGAANGVDVVAFPLEPTLRQTRNSRRVATSRTTISGEYQIEGLPPGAYGLAIVDEVDRESLKDPAFLARLQPLATVALASGEHRTQNVAVR